jgi:hypothetical protein
METLSILPCYLTALHTWWGRSGVMQDFEANLGHTWKGVLFFFFFFTFFFFFFFFFLSPKTPRRRRAFPRRADDHLPGSMDGCEQERGCLAIGGCEEEEEDHHHHRKQ